MMEAVRTSETSVDNHFTPQYNPEDSSERKDDLIPVLDIDQYILVYRTGTSFCF
jgi:hypothetical protein